MYKKVNKYELGIFISYYPIVEKEPVQIFKTDDDRLIAELKDGSAIEYDLVLGTSRSAMNLDILMRPKIAANEDDFKRCLGRKMYREMVRRGFDQIMLSKATGISKGTISYYMNGTSMPSLYKIKLIADALDCSVDELLKFDCWHWYSNDSRDAHSILWREIFIN